MVAGRKRRHEEATRTAPRPAEPHGPRRCGGPRHSAGYRISWLSLRPASSRGHFWNAQRLNQCVVHTNRVLSCWNRRAIGGATRIRRRLRGVQHDAVTAVALGLIERLVGALEDRRGGVIAA